MNFNPDIIKYVGIGLGGLFLIKHSTKIIMPIIGFIIPTKKTINAIKNDNKKEKDELIIYWPIYSCIICIFNITDCFLFWIPLYEYIKLGIVVIINYPIFSSKPGYIIIYNKLKIENILFKIDKK